MPSLVPTSHGNWLFVTPVTSLELTKDVQREFKVKRVTFIHRDRLARTRKRFGIKKLSELDRTFRGFVTNDTLAVVRHTGKPREIAGKCLRMVEEEAAILLLSYLGYDKRKYGRAMGIPGSHALGGHNYAFFNTKNKSMTGSATCPVSVFPVRLDKAWCDFQKLYYFKLLKILNGSFKVDTAWRRTLWQASVLIGRSLGTLDVATAFLWNMIALECLLTQQGDTVKDALPQRCEAFLGWVGFWKTGGFEKRIRKAYQQRCIFVHQGQTVGITRKLLLFTDDLLLNVLLNIVNHTSIFCSKKSVIQFSEKVQAEHLLGLKSKVRPKKFRAVHRTYTAKDLEDI